ncbi:MAG: nucleotidyltransferase domain-containing protein [Treponema sp.]|jgi:predicted nucleotidyltransferase|nr:nucleotidyltransferase domain-containing protein [Treponema sp.]
MVTDIETVNTTVLKYIDDVKKAMPIDKVYLYGSYAKGTQHENSDVDICFFSHAFESKSSLDVLTELFYLKINYDKHLLIEPNAFLVSELYNDNPFVKEILRTGKEIIID